MKAQLKAVLVLLATVAASASADSLRATPARPSDIVQTMPEQIVGLEYDEGVFVQADRSDEFKECKKKCIDKKCSSVSSDDNTCKTNCKKKCESKDSNSNDRSASRSSRSADSCLDDTEPKATRDGSKYKFELKKSNAKCLDKEERAYSYGEFEDVQKDSDCAKKCVEDSWPNVLKYLEGFDFSCKKERCRCLFDADVGNDIVLRPYDDYDLDFDGTGKVKETTEKDGTYCFKLKDVVGTPSSKASKSSKSSKSTNKATRKPDVDGEFDDKDDGDYEMESW